MRVQIASLTPQQVASITDHTFLKTEDAFAEHKDGAIVGRQAALQELLSQAASLKPYAVCLRHTDLGYARRHLELNYASDIKLAGVVGFPNPSSYFDDPRLIIDEVSRCADYGAKEVDFVLPRATTRAISEIERYVSQVSNEAKRRGLFSKLILETSELTEDQIGKACKLAEAAGVDMVKTSTSYARAGATVEALRAMRAYFPSGAIKISGKVNCENYQAFLTAAAGDQAGAIELDPLKIRLGASGLLPGLFTTA